MGHKDLVGCCWLAHYFIFGFFAYIFMVAAQAIF